MEKRERKIENEFLELDNENKIASIRLLFDKPSDIFYENMATKIPMINDLFTDGILQSFDMAPKHFKVDMDVVFNDLEDYDTEELETIFRKNVLLKTAIMKRGRDNQNSLALLLCGIGLVFILISIAVENVSMANETLKTIIAYVLDIMATVPFWGAMEIYLINNNEQKKYITDKLLQFHSISFHKASEMSSGSKTAE